MKNIIKNILKEETKGSLKVARDIIYNMFDEVSFIEIIPGKKLIKVYFETNELHPAANIENWFAHEICDTINKYTGLNALPWWWEGSRKDENTDVYIDVSLGGGVKFNIDE